MDTDGNRACPPLRAVGREVFLGERRVCVVPFSSDCDENRRTVDEAAKLASFIATVPAMEKTVLMAAGKTGLDLDFAATKVHRAIEELDKRAGYAGQAQPWAKKWDGDGAAVVGDGMEICVVDEEFRKMVPILAMGPALAAATRHAVTVLAGLKDDIAKDIVLDAANNIETAISGGAIWA